MRSEHLKPFKLTGTLDGPDDFDLASFAGLELTDDQYDKLWSVTNPNAILYECPCVNVIEKSEFEGLPGQSDVFFEYEATSADLLREELKVAIMRTLTSQTLKRKQR